MNTTPRRDRRWNGREWVYDAIHHLNGNPRDNRLENLRVVEVACNRQDPPPQDPLSPLT